ncbi:MAG: molybdate transporter family protein [Actinomycetota bacterium]
MPEVPEVPEELEQTGARRFRVGLGEVSGAVADLGVLVPLATALILVNGLDPSAVLLGAGALLIASGSYFGIPFPVQPLKALTAVAVAQGLAPEVIHAAGFEIGAFLLLLSIGRVADLLARLFAKPVVRALQLGVGVLLVVTAVKLVRDPPAVFSTTPDAPWPVLLAVAALAVVVWAASTKRYALAAALVSVGTLAGWLAVRPHLGAPDPGLPSLALPPASAFASAFLLLVVPQLPLTFGNAVVAVGDVARGAFGERARRVVPWRVCLSCGLGNVGSAQLGGMPMCHGAGGLTAHLRLGARTAGMNLLLGGLLVGLGVFFGARVPAVLGLLPVSVLAAFLAYAGLRHAWLVADLRGWQLAVALVAGAVGAWRSNLALTAAIGLIAVHGAGLARRLRSRGTATEATTASG